MQPNVLKTSLQITNTTFRFLVATHANTRHELFHLIIAFLSTAPCRFVWVLLFFHTGAGIVMGVMAEREAPRYTPRCVVQP